MTALNIRPFTDALRGTRAPWGKAGDKRIGGERIVTLQCLFRGTEPVYEPAAQAGDRWLTIQLWGDGLHHVSHMFATCDCPRGEGGHPQYLRGITRPTDFKTPAEMLIAIQVELLRGDHTPPPSALNHGPLDQRTSMLVDRFAFALKEKLLESQSKYGWTDDWARDDWQDRCTQALCDHLAKGDPRDVAAFAAFMWHHGWPTATLRAGQATTADALLREAHHGLERAEQFISNGIELGYIHMPDKDSKDSALEVPSIVLCALQKLEMHFRLLEGQQVRIAEGGAA